MTSPSPDHLDLDALADALAGESSEADATHLAGCGSCAGRLAELRAAEGAVLAQLQGVGAPALPPDVAARWDAALAEQEPPVPARTATVRALPVRRAGRSTAGWLPAAAAAVLVLGGAALGVSLVASGMDGGGSEAASSAAGGAADAASPASDLLLTASGADWADPAAPTAVLPRVLGGGATPYQLAEDGDGRAAAAESQEGVGLESEDADEPAAPAPAAALPEADGELARLSTPTGLEACLTALLEGEQQPGVRPLAVDYASYDGQPALAVVLPDPDPTQASIFVVGSDCSATDPDVLLFRRAPLP